MRRERDRVNAHLQMMGVYKWILKQLDAVHRQHMLLPMPAFRHATPSDSRRVSLFRNGANQALRIPREFELPTTEALLFREGKRLIIEAYPQPPSLLSTLERLEILDESFPDVDKALLPVDSVEL